MSEQDPQPAIASSANTDQPWLGLNSFTEQTRDLFHGRDEEVAELSRRIQRKTLTVLFGQSGVGKTSMVCAGVVPHLRRKGYCPVYVRISYADDAPPAAEQIKQAVLRATTAVGRWTRPGVAAANESLWEFLHHRDDRILDADAYPLLPLLIFDQFEEIFTLAQSDDKGKQRTTRFLMELADLVENRPPEALEARIDQDDALAEEFDFARNDYRVVLALREDYLAHLESLRLSMPSVTQNHMRLGRMTGAQALSAVLMPGRHLISEEAAAGIVRFVAGGAELRNAEVEPALLSLVCRELNNKRIARGSSEISAELLAGSHESILSEFYQHALEGMSEAIHVVIEDQLLTENGYRENLSEESVQKAFAAANAAPDTLSTLVNRRLLRIEERLDVRRVELTHDVLCGVVMAAREQRQVRVAKRRAQEQLTVKDREQTEIRRQLLRARQAAGACIFLVVVAAVASLSAYHSDYRAKLTRDEAEELAGYLIDDFYEDLRPLGRLDLAKGLAEKAVHYTEHLREVERTAETERLHAMALARLGSVELQLGNPLEANKRIDQAIDMLGGALKRDGSNERVVINYAEAIKSRVNVAAETGNIRDALPMFNDALKLLRPLAANTHASEHIRRAFASVLTRRGWCELRLRKYEEASATLREAKAWLNTTNWKDSDAGAAAYVEASSWLYDALIHSDPPLETEAQQVLTFATEVGNDALQRRPDHFQIQESMSRMQSSFSEISLEHGRVREAINILEKDRRTRADLLQIDVNSISAWAAFSDAHGKLIVPHWSLGDVDDAVNEGEDALRMYSLRKPSALQSRRLAFNALQLASIHAERGEVKDAVRVADLARKYAEQTYANRPPEDLERRRGLLRMEIALADVRRVLGQNVTLAESAALMGRMEQIRKDTPPAEARDNSGLLRDAYMLDSQLALHRGDFARAEAGAAKAYEAKAKYSVFEVDRAATVGITLALARARQGHISQARSLTAKLIDEHRERIASGADDLYLRVELAAGLIVQALSHPGEGAAELSEAQTLLDSLPPKMQALKSVREWQGQLANAVALR
jgi:tetratricopeptide (TPR) repeat protein